MTTIKLKNGSGAPTAGDLAQGEPALDLTNKRLYTEDSGGTVIEVGVNPTSVTTGNITATGTATFAGLTTTADVSFGDNDKAIFGADSDMSLFHNGNNGFLDNDTGTLFIQTDALSVKNAAGTESVMLGAADGAVTLYHNNAAKLATTSTGIDVTGTVTASSGVDITNGSSSFNRTHPTTTASLQVLNVKATSSGDMADGFGPSIVFAAADTGTTSNQIAEINVVRAGSDTAFDMQFQTADATRLNIASNGDVSLFEDTGTTAKLFWDASAERLGVGSSSPTEQLDVQLNAIVNESGAGDKGLFVGPSGFAGSFVYKSSGDAEIAPRSGKSLIFAASTGGTERMRIDSSGNVGIGSTNTSGFKLDVAGTARANNLVFRADTSAPSGDAAIFRPTGGTIALSTNSAERMRIDGSGQVGIGTLSPARDLHIESSNPRFRIADSDGGYAEISGNGGHVSIQADAGNTQTGSRIDFEVDGSQKARIDTSGNLLVGTTDSSVYNNSGSGTGINLQNFGNIAVARDGNDCMVLNRLNSDGAILNIAKDGTTVGSISSHTGGFLKIDTEGNSSGLLFGTSAIYPIKNNVIDDDAVDLGDSSNRFKDLYLSGGVRASTLKFENLAGTTEYGRFDSSGNLLVNTSSANAKVYALNNGGTGLSSIRADNNSNNYTAHHFWSVLGGSGNDNTTAIHMAGYTASGNRFVIYGNGDIVNNNNSYGALSDLKLKENIINASSQWDDIKAVTIRKYSMKEDNLDAPNKLGVIAQELEAAGMGGLVYESPDRDSNGEILDTTTKQVKYSILYMKAIKALQEAMNRIEILEAEVTALKGEN